MKYLFFYETTAGKELLQYETDAEPPRVGDIVQLHMILDDEMLPAQRVTQIYYAPESPQKTNIFIYLEEYQIR